MRQFSVDITPKAMVGTPPATAGMGTKQVDPLTSVVL